MKKSSPDNLIKFRPITDRDLPFLSQLYADTRAQEMAMSGWEQQQIDRFLQMQFDLQHKQWMENYPDAQFDIILYDKIPAGRLYVHRKKDDIRIIDIALLSRFRLQGIGTWLMNRLTSEADKKQLPLSLHVEHNNPVMGLYERLGFTRQGELKGVYYFMSRPPLEPGKI
ncbi:MAG: GNAT family N-acetyltransferase [Desulfobacterales bacterium]|nr:GNAT family N-acetyltransferase [Desulfobacterales bacterium]